MSDFKFSCPKCGQNIVCDTSNAGMVLACPACQNSLTVPPPPPAVPAAGTKLGINKTMHVHQAPPPPGAANAPAKPAWGTKAEPPAPKKTSVLAIVSLVCSLLGGIGAIPGIICGHLARARIARDSSLKGAGLAKAGLIISYLSLALIIGWFGFGASYYKKYLAEKQQQAEEVVRQAEEQAKAAKAAEAAAEAKRAGWKMDLSAAEFPDRPASGKLHAVNFTVETALFSSGTLAFRQESGGSREFLVSSLLKPGESIINKSFNIASTDTNRVPRVTMVWKDLDAPKAASQIFTNGYAMKLQFGAVADGKLSGKIYLSVPDAEKSYVGGNFEIMLKAPGAPATPAAAPPPGQPGNSRQPGGGGQTRSRRGA